MKKWYRVKQERNILRIMKGKKGNCIGHILPKNCLLKHVIEVKLEETMQVMGRRGRRFNKLMHDLKKKRRKWKLKEEGVDRTPWRTRFGRGYGPIVIQEAK
jgi:hypothetical protein